MKPRKRAKEKRNHPFSSCTRVFVTPCKSPVLLLLSFFIYLPRSVLLSLDRARVLYSNLGTSNAWSVYVFVYVGARCSKDTYTHTHTHGDTRNEHVARIHVHPHTHHTHTHTRAESWTSACIRLVGLIGRTS